MQFQNISSVITYISENDIEAVDFKICDLFGRWRHLTIPSRRFSPELLEKGIGFDASNYGYLVTEKSDMIFKPDLSVAFLDRYNDVPTLSFLTNVFTTGDSSNPHPYSPRRILAAACELLVNLNIADNCLLGPELEFNVLDELTFDNDPENSWFCLSKINDSEEKEGPFHPIRKNMAYHANPPFDALYGLRSRICQYLEELGIMVKYHHHEVGDTGQMEIELEFDSPQRAADNILLLKYAVRNEAYLDGKYACFMPKIVYGEAGNGMHVHFKLFKDGKSVLYKKGARHNLSDTARFFIGGLLRHAPALLAFTNPSTNSYKRLNSGHESPTGLFYDLSNRTAAIRIPGYAIGPEDVRFEFRPPDATSNPYLAFAAMLMAGIDGIVNKTDPDKEGFYPFDSTGNLVCEQVKSLPDHLDLAFSALKDDMMFLTRENVFHETFITQWIEMKTQLELEPFRQRPTPYEFELYYDI